MSLPLILLPLHPASLVHENPQRCTKVYGMHPVGHKDRLTDRSEDVFVEYPVCVITVAVFVVVV